MKKIIATLLAVALIIPMCITPTIACASESPKQVLYKITPNKDNEKMGRYIELESTGDIITFGDWQEYVTLDRDVSFVAYGLKVEKVEKDKLTQKPKLTKGMYLVGCELEPGIYELTGDGTAIMMSSASLDKNKDFIQDTAVVLGNGETKYITVEKGHYALYLLNVSAKRVK